jgi:hypothetical protein
LGCFHLFWLLWVMLLRTPVYKFLYGRVHFSRNRITESNSLSNCQSVFQNSCTMLYSNKKCLRVSNFSTFLQHLLFACVFKVIVTLVDVRLCWTIVLISLTTYDVKQLCTWFLPFIHLGEMSIQILCPCLNCPICGFYWVVRVLYKF